jgi:phosphoadenosine phosphosulfate reductase
VALNYDNDTTKDAVEMCYRRRKTLVNPIIAWEDEDVWEFLNDVAKVPHCKLYDQGWTRLGCIGCPMSPNRVREMDAYPAFKRAYMSAFTRMLRERESRIA